MGEEQAFGFPGVLAISFVRILVFKEQYLEVGLGVIRRLKLLPDTKPRDQPAEKCTRISGGIVLCFLESLPSHCFYLPWPNYWKGLAWLGLLSWPIYLLSLVDRLITSGHFSPFVYLRNNDAQRIKV